MIGFRINYDPSFFKKRTRKDTTVKMHKILASLWRSAIREYLRAIVLEDVVKVETGMSMASLIPLAKAVRMATEVRSKIAGARTKRGVQGVYSITGEYNRFGYKTPATGERFGKKAYNIEVGTAKSPNFIFEFEISVYQYLLREHGVNGKDTNSTPWDSLNKGRDAFYAYINKELPKFRAIINAFVRDGIIRASPWEI